MSTKRKTRRKDRTLLSFKKERKIDLTARICQGLREVKLIMDGQLKAICWMRQLLEELLRMLLAI